MRGIRHSSIRMVSEFSKSINTKGILAADGTIKETSSRTSCEGWQVGEGRRRVKKNDTERSSCIVHRKYAGTRVTQENIYHSNEPIYLGP